MATLGAVQHIPLWWNTTGYAIDVPAGMLINLCAMDGLRSRANPKPLVPAALRRCLEQLAKTIYNMVQISRPVVVHMPRIGAGLAGGSWPEVEAMLNQTLCANQIPIIVYDLPGEDHE